MRPLTFTAITARPLRTAARAAWLASLLLACSLPASAQRVIKVDTIRSPSYEIFLKRMGTALPGVKVAPTMLPVDKLVESYSIKLSSKSDALDIMYMNDGILRQYAKNGWLQPLDDLWDKYRIVIVSVGHENAKTPSLSYRGLRVTPNIYTPLEEIDTFVEAMQNVVKNGLPA